MNPGKTSERGRCPRLSSSLPCYFGFSFLIDGCRVATWHYGSPSHGVVEQQLLIPGFLPEFLETLGLRKFIDFLEKVEIGTAGGKSDNLNITPRQASYESAQINIKEMKSQERAEVLPEFCET